MGLDITLYASKTLTCDCGKVHVVETEKEVYSTNITHNLNNMADEAGIYRHLWEPERIGITVAKDLIDPLTKGLQSLKEKPEYYSQFNASNGWGMYEHFVPFVERYLNACIANPEATIYVSR